jgi:hypothetical protein
MKIFFKGTFGTFEKKASVSGFINFFFFIKQKTQVFERHFGFLLVSYTHTQITHYVVVATP